ncbi:MAG: hypothetical protein KIS81_08630 [Maricaulaceae bacterium]|nr:hypothetical protein [Maricaulaceae bacterium]
MMRLFAAALAAAALAAPAWAQQSFNAEFDAAPPRAIAVGEIAIGETLAGKADEYGAREFDRLIAIVRTDLERELSAAGRLAADGDAGATLVVTIEDAMPNRPTVAMMGPPRNLDMRSLFAGGASLSALLVAADGAEIARFSYSWRTPDIYLGEASGTWTDARRASDRFAARTARAIAEQGEGGF